MWEVFNRRYSMESSPKNVKKMDYRRESLAFDQTLLHNDHENTITHKNSIIKHSGEDNTSGIYI